MKKFAALGFIVVAACVLAVVFVPRQGRHTSRAPRVTIHHPALHGGEHEEHHSHVRHFNPDFHWADLQRALKQRRKILARSAQRASALPHNGWKALGPGNIGGRTLAIYIDPNNPEHLIIGTAGGGIWTSTNGGQSWAPVNDFMGSLAVNAIAYDPVNGTLYAGTGEYDTGDGMLGAGIFTSTDNGKTWKVLGSTNPVNNNAWFFTTALAVNPSGVILASTWEGLMRSTDGGQTWTQTYTGLASDVVFDPNNPNNALIDVSPSQIPTQTSSSYVAWSTDAGRTWTQVQIVDGGTQSFVVNSPAPVAGSYTVGSAAFNPSSANVTADLIVAANSGGTISDGCTTPFANGSAIAGKIALIERGSCAFTQKVENAQDAGAVGALIVDDVDEAPFTMGGTDSAIVIPSFLITQADGASIENALQNGAVNATITIQVNPNGGSGRVRLAYAKSAPGVVYAAVDYQKGTIYKSTDGGKTWTQLAVVKNDVENLYDIGGGDQGSYDDPLWVDPTDANHLVAGGIDLWQSTDGGKTWTQVSDWTRVPVSPHADHHAIASLGSHFYDGDDGGVYTTSSIGTVTTTSGWTSLNNGLGITQFYSVAGKASAGSAGNGGVAPIIGGTQDNGCEIYTGNANGWLEYAGGDGGFAAVNPTNGNDLYCEYVFLDINRSQDGGATVDWPGDNIPDVGTQSANFIAPFVLDPNNSNTVLAGGQSLWRSTNIEAASPNWSSINGSTLPVTTGNYISAIAIAHGDSNDVWVGYNDGSVWHSNDATDPSPTWSRIGGVPGPEALVRIGLAPKGAVNRIVIDPANKQSVYVMFESFVGDGLWHSANGGTSWADLSAGLPDAPTFDIAINPADANTLYVATEVGMFTSTDGGNTWSTSNDGPANVRIRDLDWFDNAHLIAATHGRGMWEMTVANVNPTPVLTGLAPASATVGSGGFTLTVNGKDFVKGAKVSFDGTKLTTSYVSATKLTAQVSATLIAQAGEYAVTVGNPAPSGASNAKIFTVANPAPVVTGISPSSVTAGSADLTLAVNGKDFVKGADVSFGATKLTTTYVSATKLTAQVSAALLAQAGQYAVTVSNPAPGGGVSNSETFTVTRNTGGGGNSGGGGGGFGILVLGLLFAFALIRRRMRP